MPSTRSAAKQARASLRRQARNQTAESNLYSTLRKMSALLQGGKKDEAKALYPKVVSTLDKAVQHGRLHRNAAARRKSRLAHALKAAA